MNKGWFKKGHQTNRGKHWILTAETKGKIARSKKGFHNSMWKGLSVGYSGLHKWIRRNFGTPSQCEHCGTDGLSHQKIHWANKSGRYLRTRSDWMRLCARCHKKYDKK